MSKKSDLHIGSIGGNLSVGGDIVAGDKITTGDSSIIINYGFKKEEDKEEFISQMEELLSMINKISSQLDKIEGLDNDKRSEIIDEITRQVKSLKTAKEEADGLPVGQEAPKEKVKTIEGYLDKTRNLMDKLQKIGTKIADFGNKALPLVSKALLILTNVRTLFGLP